MIARNEKEVTENSNSKQSLVVRRWLLEKPTTATQFGRIEKG
jgi:hypothetical protein